VLDLALFGIFMRAASSLEESRSGILGFTMILTPSTLSALLMEEGFMPTEGGNPSWQSSL